MFPFLFHQRQKPKEELERERIAREAKELKQALEKMTPEERARFWADNEGGNDDQRSQGSPGG